jgi:hypothetical protein
MNAPAVTARSRPDPTSVLIAAFRAAFTADIFFEEVKTRAWSSVTFRGARHELRFRVEAPTVEDQAEAFLERMQDRRWIIGGHLVADIEVTASERRPGLARFSIQVVTVEV